MIKYIVITILLFIQSDLFANDVAWNFEINNNNEEELIYSSYIFSNNLDNFFSVYCEDNQNELYFLMNIKKEIFPEELNVVTVYFDNDRSVEYQLAVDYNKNSLFFNKSSFYIGYNNYYQFPDFINNIKTKNNITFLSRLDERHLFSFDLKNSFNSLNLLKQHCVV